MKLRSIPLNTYYKTMFIIIGVILSIIVLGEVAEFAGELYRKWFL